MGKKHALLKVAINIKQLNKTKTNKTDSFATEREKQRCHTLFFYNILKLKQLHQHKALDAIGYNFNQWNAQIVTFNTVFQAAGAFAECEVGVSDSFSMMLPSFDQSEILYTTKEIKVLTILGTLIENTCYRPMPGENDGKLSTRSDEPPTHSSFLTNYPRTPSAVLARFEQFIN